MLKNKTLESKFLSRKPTIETARVLKILTDSPTTWHYGYGLATQANVSLNTIYRLIDKLDDEKLITQTWEDSKDDAPRAKRHLFKLTEDGINVLSLVRHKFEVQEHRKHSGIKIPRKKLRTV